jgi:hypothetical protein
MRKTWIVCVALSVATCLLVPAAGDASSNPSVNFAPRAACAGAAACLNQSISFLDQARSKLGLPSYALPRNFASLAPPEQLLVLTDLDRLAYGLRPIQGLTAALDQAAVGGVLSASDPLPGDPNLMAFTSNWANGYRNAEFAYEAWMYADGLGGKNLDCTALTPSRCWDHRDNILKAFGSGPLAMGAAAGIGPGGIPGYTALLVEGSGSYRPAFLYTWSDAVAAGAGGSSTARPHAHRRCVRHRRRRHHRHHHHHRLVRCRR